MNSTEQPAVTGPVEPPVVQHTPGPWHTNGYSSPVTGTIVVYHKPFGLGDVADVHDAADALLIAAAPDLLMALQMLYAEAADYIRLNNLGGMDNHCMRLARAALERAGAA